MNKVKITILKIGYDEDLAKEYGIEGLGTCPAFEEGQVFYADAACPKGFCSEAWKAIYQYAFAFAHGVDEPLYYNDWIRVPGVAICTCNDGIRPVTMKIERTNIVAEKEGDSFDPEP